MELKFFKSTKIFDNVTAISGLAGELCYLVEGKNKALLIDTLTGVGSLKAFVRELTNLPVTVVNTHGHVDHCGANYEYGECYIHPDDILGMYEHGDIDRRFEFATSGVMFGIDSSFVTREDVIPPVAIKTVPVYDGDIFDLGGIKIETIAVPGHTFGSLVFLDRDRRVVYSGDACNRNTLLFLPNSTTIEDYKQSLLHFKEYQPYFDVMYGGHGLEPVDKTIIDEAIELCDMIMTGNDDKIESEYINRKCYYAKAKNERFQRIDGKVANIAYDVERINNLHL